MARSIAVLVMAAVVLTACGGDTVPGEDPPPAGPGISVAEAIQLDRSDRVVVNGYLFVRGDGGLTLADAIAESFPPQPGGAKLEVVGLDPSQVTGLQSAGDVSWTDELVQLSGTMREGKLLVDSE